jgi:hypothetical protein
MPKEFNGLSDLKLSHWFPTRSSHASDRTMILPGSPTGGDAHDLLLQGSPILLLHCRLGKRLSLLGFCPCGRHRFPGQATSLL